MSPVLHRSLLLVGAVLSLSCGSTGAPDASAPATQRVAEVSVRIDAPTGGVPAVSVLAFRASVMGLPASDVLGVIDPLVASAASQRCELQEIGTPIGKLRGGNIDLEELAHVSLVLGADAVLKPAPRVYPQLGSGVAGVFGEAGPLDLTALPESIDVTLPGEEHRVTLAIAGAPRLLDQSGEALTAATRLDPTHDVQLTVAGPAHALEIRPFGASRFIACPVGAGGRVVVQRELIDRLKASGSHGAVSFEAVWRDSRLVSGSPPTRLSIEARSSAVLDLRAQIVPPAETAKPSLPTGP